MNFDMNTCWSRAVELVQDNFSLLSAVAAVFFLLPTMALYLLIPDMQTLADPSTNPEVMAARMTEILLPLMGIVVATMVVQFVGYATMVALMSDERPTVGQALAAGVKVLPGMLVILLLFGLVYIIGAMLIMVPITLLAGVAGAPALGLIGVFPVLLFVVWLMARMSMSMPVMVLGGRINPLGAISASFAMTKPKQWPILLFWFVIFVVMTIIGVLVSGVSGLIAALVGTGTASMVVLGITNGAWGMLSGMIVSALAVAMYAQLSGPSASAIEETFD